MVAGSAAPTGVVEVLLVASTGTFSTGVDEVGFSTGAAGVVEALLATST